MLPLRAGLGDLLETAKPLGTRFVVYVADGAAYGPWDTYDEAQIWVFESLDPSACTVIPLYPA